jgi:GNAT superfamily N-acetyltransferase
MNVGEAQTSDIGRIIPMTRAFHHAARLNDYAAWDEGKWSAWLTACIEHDSGLCILATNGSEVPVGFATAVVVPSYWDPDVLVCQETVLWCVPESRGEGVGKAMINAVADWGKAKGCVVMAVGTQQHMEPRKTAVVYKKLGFELVEKAYSRRL